MRVPGTLAYVVELGTGFGRGLYCRGPSTASVAKCATDFAQDDGRLWLDLAQDDGGVEVEILEDGIEDG